MSNKSQECWENSQQARSDNAAWAIAAAIFSLADAVGAGARHLGTGNAATQQGAIEGFGMHVGEKIDSLSSAIDSVASGLNEIAKSIDTSKPDTF